VRRVVRKAAVGASRLRCRAWWAAALLNIRVPIVIALAA
jgi:hypothetical protein